jgi:predicted RND superfamily exporter protein
MFAAIAIGTGVDFAVHLLDRLLVAVRDEGQTIDEALATLFPSTGRALLFNSSAVIAGFGMLTLSDVPPLVWFGTLVSVAALVSFLASLTLLPAIVQVLRPRAIGAGGIGANSQ